MKDLYKRWKVDVITLQETKLQQVGKKIVIDLWGCRPFKFLHKEADGKLGGPLVAWNSKSIEVLEHMFGDFSVSIICQNRLDSFKWVFSAVYGPVMSRVIKKNPSIPLLTDQSADNLRGTPEDLPPQGQITRICLLPHPEDD